MGSRGSSVIYKKKNVLFRPPNFSDGPWTAKSRSKTTTCFVNSLLSGSFLIKLKKKRISTRCFVCSPRCAFRKEPRRIASTLSTSRSSVFHFKSSVFFFLAQEEWLNFAKKKSGLSSTVPGLEPRIAWSALSIGPHGQPRHQDLVKVCCLASVTNLVGKTAILYGQISWTAWNLEVLVTDRRNGTYV